MIMTIGWCDYDKGVRRYQASVDAFPEILGIGITRTAAAKDLERRIQAACRAVGQYDIWTGH